VLKWVVLGLDEDVEAEDGLQQRRVRMRDALDVGGRQLEADSDRILSLAKNLTRSSRSRDLVATMRWIFVIVGTPLAAVALFIGRAGAENELLIATVGTNDGYDIALRHQDGTKVTTLVPGTYTVRVRDLSRIHNLHLASNEDTSVDFRTDLEFVGEQDFTVTFRNGTRYAYACEPHWETMNGSFFVSSPVPPPPPKPKLRTLRATVAANGTATLSSRSVKAGSYKITVRDRSRRYNFRLSGRRLNRATGAVFTGSVTWRVRLASGLYRYGSDAKRLPGRLRVS
jgi:plastocyanin